MNHAPATESSEKTRLEPTGRPQLLCVIPLFTEHEFTTSSSLASEIVTLSEGSIQNGDILVIASKIIAKVEGRLVNLAPDTHAGPEPHPAPTRNDLIAQETERIVARRQLPSGHETWVVASRSGQVMAAAGIDSSNVPPNTALLLPHDCDASAARLRADIYAATGINVGVLITDTNGRPWRVGVADVALGAAGFEPLDDNRGLRDDHGREMTVTVRAIADELAAAADLVKGKATRTPFALVRGLGCPELLPPGTSAAARGTDLNRTGNDDWFAYGHVEGIRASLNADHLGIPAPPIDPATDTEHQKWLRAIAVATSAGPTPYAWHVDLDPVRTLITLSHPGTPSTAQFIALGTLIQRLHAALFSESAAALNITAIWAGAPENDFSYAPKPPYRGAPK